MMPRHAAQVAFGVMGVYFVASGILSAVTLILISLQGTAQAPDFQLISALQPALTMGFGIGMIVLRCALAAMLAPDTEPVEEGTATGGVQAAAIAVIGIFFLASGLQLFLAERFANSSGWQSSPQTLPEMAVGAALFFGARGLVVVWQKLRTAGRSGD